LFTPSKLNGVVEDLIVVEEAAKSHNHILSGDTLWKNTSKRDFGNGGDLPPGLARGPDTCCICSDHCGAQTPYTAVHVAVTVTGHRHRPWPRVALLHHDLMANSSASWVKVDSLLLGKLLNLLVLLEVRFTLILDIVVERHDDLLRVVDLASPNGHEFQGHRPGVIVCHTPVWREGDIVARLDDLALCKAEGISLHNLLGQGLWGARGCLE